MDEAVSNRGPSDKDDAVAMVGEVQHEIDPVVEARAVRKIDWFLIPAMICGCQFSLLLNDSSGEVEAAQRHRKKIGTC